jgi:uncharacterized protein (DUF1501 family)
MTTPLAAFNGNGDDQRALVVIFLRGGADGLTLVPPLGDDGYFRARPTLNISKKIALPLDGFFGLHPQLKEMQDIFKDGSLAVIHACGSEDNTRSHFEAQDFMEHGGLVGGGWLARFLRNREDVNNSALAAIAISRELPEVLRGSPSVAVMLSLDEFSLGKGSGKLAAQLEKLYGAQTDALGLAGLNTLKELRRIEQLRATQYTPENGAEYPNDYFGRGLTQIARLIKARVGLQAASLDLHGWDSHFAQTTLIEPLMQRLAKGLFAFYRDMGRAMETTTVVVMTEFGRTIRENSAFGTDHGGGGVMFVMGGGVKGGRVLGEWGGLETNILEFSSDVPVKTNYRNVLAPILLRHGADEKKMGDIFPEFEIKAANLYS